MKGRLAFIAGVAAGYVIGTRAGRQAYDTIKQRVQDASTNPQVQSIVGRAKDLAGQRAPKLTGLASAAAGTAAEVGDAVKEAGGSESRPEAPPAEGGGATGPAAESARVFEQATAETGGAIDGGASSMAGSGDADESSSPTATS
jgi:hypothetical protein